MAKRKLSARSARRSTSTKSRGGATVTIGRKHSASTKRQTVPGTRLRQSRKGTTTVPGERVGSKRSDMRWLAPDGQVWASKFEYSIYLGLIAGGYDVRRTGPEDSLAYQSTVKQGVCLECGSRTVAQDHRYTPDLFVSATRSGVERGEAGVGDPAAAGARPAGYYIEAKGYLRADRRSLLRAFRKAQPSVDLRLVIQRDYKVGKGSLVSWAQKYLKVPVHVWNGTLPEDWNAQA